MALRNDFQNRIASAAAAHLVERLPNAPLHETVAPMLAMIEERAGSPMLPAHRQAVGETLEALLLEARSERAGWPSRPCRN